MSHFTSTSRHEKPIYNFEMNINGIKLESVQCINDFGMTITPSFKFSQQGKDAAVKARMPDFTTSNQECLILE